MDVLKDLNANYDTPIKDALAQLDPEQQSKAKELLEKQRQDGDKMMREKLSAGGGGERRANPTGITLSARGVRMRRASISVILVAHCVSLGAAAILATLAIPARLWRRRSLTKNQELGRGA